MTAKWNIRIGNHMYKRNISLNYAYEIAEQLQDEVLGIQIHQSSEAVEARRSVEAG